MKFSGERLRVVYRLTGDEVAARQKARAICFEQTVEFPEDLTPAGDVREKIVGKVERFEAAGIGKWEVVIGYAVETSGYELPQLLNVVFGNTSLQPGVRVERLELPDSLLGAFRGPRFGRAGLRAWLGIPTRPLLCTALKPMGLGPKELADLAYRFALGGLDIVKDDHGLADQPFAPFRERVERCAEAVARANRETGLKCIYAPNITGPADRVIEKALFAKQVGAGGLLVSPGLAGLDTMRLIADDDRIALPIIAHPALQGSFVVGPENGLSHFVLFGQIARLAGADASIFPNFGGRFSFSREACRSVAEGCTVEMGRIKPIFPTPGGGMSLDSLPGMYEVYGPEVIFLIGGGLHRRGPDLVENCRNFVRLAEGL